MNRFFHMPRSWSRLAVRCIPGERGPWIRAAFLTCLLLVLPAGLANAQDADGRVAEDYFHTGARSFISENLAEASATVGAGLRAYPDDAELRRLDELIRQAQEQQSQQQQGESQQESDESRGDNQSGEQQQGEPQNGDEEEQSGDQEGEQQQQEPTAENDESRAPDEQHEEQTPESSETPSPGMPVPTDRLSREEAERILQALANEEEQLLREVQKIQGRPRHVEKDW